MASDRTREPSGDEPSVRDAAASGDVETMGSGHDAAGQWSGAADRRRAPRGRRRTDRLGPEE